ncbi:transposase [Sinomicrobium sp. M5D2P9]
MAKAPKNGVFLLLILMKLQRFSELQHTFSFLSSTEQLTAYRERFFESDLGKIYCAVPWDAMVREFGLKESGKGTRMMFSPRGRLALMFLKHHAGCSDRKLIEQLNSNIDYQFFCDIHLGLKRITNYKIVSQIRCELAACLSITDVEKALYAHWKAYIAEPGNITMDATCYESEVRYPTNQKLLWECVDWLYRQVGQICKVLGIARPRSKYRKWKQRYIGYSKMRKKTVKKRRSLTRALLKLLHKLLAFVKQLQKQYDFTMPERFYNRLRIIQKVYAQQYVYFTTGNKPKGRIISLSKDYLRPIVRGKEIKQVEFGAKVHKLQIDRISFIEHLSFNAFNEGTRFTKTIYKAQGMTKTKVKIAGADAIYATNKNRVFATSHNIQTDFKPKGRPSKHHKAQKQLGQLITKERASSLEGSFGKEKEYYHLKKVKARTGATETLWIFLGIHTANALEIGRRMAQARLQKTA